MDGILLIDKEKDWTSHDVCQKIKHLLKVDKVGHSGTLDPFATGLLIVAINKATKALLYANFSYKTYIAELALGSKTSTGDVTGEVIENKDVPNLNKEQIKEVLSSFVGHSSQLVPMTSAVHVNGMKLYKYAQQGLDVERPSREIDIKYIKLLSFDKNIIKFQCLVSSGTYIRVLGEDIAEKLNTVGHLVSLKRIAFGENESLKLEDAIKIEDVNIDQIKSIINFIDLPHYEIDEEMAKRIICGQTVPLQTKENKVLIVYNNDAIAVYQRDHGDYFKCERGLW